MQITTDADYEAALDRADKLMGSTKNSPEDRELAEIVDAIEQWLDQVRVESGSNASPIRILSTGTVPPPALSRN